MVGMAKRPSPARKPASEPATKSGARRGPRSSDARHLGFAEAPQPSLEGDPLDAGFEERLLALGHLWEQVGEDVGDRDPAREREPPAPGDHVEEPELPREQVNGS